MIPFVAGAAWAALVSWLLHRILQQFRAHAADVLATAQVGVDASSVAVIVPARNEALNIEPCLAALLAQAYPPGRLAIVAVDDDSQDATLAGMTARAARDPRVRVVSAPALPAGWLGKPHACWTGVAAAGEPRWLCFVDADVRLEPPLLASAVTVAEKRGIDLLSLQPFQELGSPAEKLVIPAGMLMIACWKGSRTSNVSGADELTVNGQFLLIRTSVYRALGGHAAVRGEVSEDNALARLVGMAGYTVRVLDAERLARTRMYRDLPSLWEGFGKNAVDILGSAGRTRAAALAGVLVACCALAIPMALGRAAWLDRRPLPALGCALGLAGSGIMFGIYGATLRHFRASLLLTPLFPLGVLMTAALGWRSVRLRRRGEVRWKGRAYRLGPAAQATW